MPVGTKKPKTVTNPELPTGLVELYRKHRPQMFKGVVGQPQVVEFLQGHLKKGTLPHVLLFAGPSGTGKTTVARILKKKLDCSDMDFAEINAAESRGIDDVRKIQQRLGVAPLNGSSRIWLLDEAHKLSNDAQNALLKPLEDTPKHVYFILATTDPEKLIATIRGRCTKCEFQSVPAKALEALVRGVAEQEGIELTQDVVDRIVEVADGGARKALVLLHQIQEVEDEQARLDMLEKVDAKRQSIEIARALINPQTNWKMMSAVLKNCTELTNDGAEGLRWMVLGYCTSVLLGGGKLSDRAAYVIRYFRDHLFDSKRAGFIENCYACITGK